MRFDGDVLFTPDAGVVRAAAALEALERAARSRGADIRFAHAVTVVDEGPYGVALTVDAGGERLDVVADTVVVTAGAWTAGILPDAFPLPRLTVTEESPAHFAPRSADLAWPSFNHFVDPQRGPIGNVYGMPTPGEGV
jgi:sarcosine oxidase